MDPALLLGWRRRRCSPHSTTPPHAASMECFFCTACITLSPCIALRCPISHQNSPLILRELEPHLLHSYLDQLTQSTAPNGISIKSAVLLQYTLVTNGPTDRETDRTSNGTRSLALYVRRDLKLFSITDRWRYHAHARWTHRSAGLDRATPHALPR